MSASGTTVAVAASDATQPSSSSSQSSVESNAHTSKEGSSANSPAQTSTQADDLNIDQLSSTNVFAFGLQSYSGFEGSGPRTDNTDRDTHHALHAACQTERWLTGTALLSNTALGHRAAEPCMRSASMTLLLWHPQALSSGTVRCS
jgi:hypothetical protein